MTDPAAPTTGRTFVSPLPPREVSLNPSSTNGSADADADVDSGAPPRPKPGLWVAAESDSIPAHLAPAAFYVATTAFGLGTLAGCAALLGAPMFSPRTVQGAMQSGWGWGGQPENGGKEVRWLWDRPQFFVFLAAWAVFHMLEFVITAVYNSTRLFADSFLLHNGLSYHLAHACGLLEFILEAWLLPHRKTLCAWNYLGLAMMLSGQAVRSLAMIHAASNFSHTVAWKKRDDHALVTKGVYSFARHPSYLGFFYWALGTQIMLANPVSIVVFAVVLWRFFKYRIEREERYLVSFFGQEYVQYRARVGTWLPFIR